MKQGVERGESSGETCGKLLRGAAEKLQLLPWVPQARAPGTHQMGASCIASLYPSVDRIHIGDFVQDISVKRRATRQHRVVCGDCAVQ